MSALTNIRELDSLNGYELRALVRELGEQGQILVQALLDLPRPICPTGTVERPSEVDESADGAGAEAP